MSDQTNTSPAPVTSLAVERGRKGITVHEGGGFSCVGRDAVNLYRLHVLKTGLEMEIRGMRMTRGRTCFAVIKQEFGLKGGKRKVYEAFCAMHGFEPKPGL